MEIDRREFLGATSLVVAGLATGCTARTSSPASSSAPAADNLPFDTEAYAEKTTTISTDSGDKTVTYRFYGPITYVANPVNSDYQSLVISVPTSVNGAAVDATNAPIVFANAVGGYMPDSVKDATGVGEASMGKGPRAGGPPMPGGTPPSGGEVASGGNAMLDEMGKMVNLAQLAVAAGYVAVEPGCRGRSLVDSDGVYYGTAPAPIVDLKAAIRYLRVNADRIPGNTDRIVSTGTSAAGRFRHCSAHRGIARCTKSISTNSVRRPPVTRSSLAETGAPSLTSATPTVPTSGTGVQFPPQKVSWIRCCRSS